jgi:hypothetical protein
MSEALLPALRDIRVIASFLTLNDPLVAPKADAALSLFP